MKKQLAVLLGSLVCSSIASAATYYVAIEDWGVRSTEESAVSALFHAIAEKTGDEFEFVHVPVGMAEKSLLENKADFMSGVKAGLREKGKFAFSKAYASSEVSALMLGTEATSVKKLKGKVVCATTSQEINKAKEYGSKVLQLKRWQEKYVALSENKCVALLGLRVNNEMFLKADPARQDLYIHKHKLLNFSDKLSVITTKEKKDFLPRINKALKAMKKDGTLDALTKKHF